MHQHKRDMTTFPPTVKAAKQAYAMAGIGPADIDVAEVHDCFTGVELIDYEDLGFCERFEALQAHRGRVTPPSAGALPVNPSGGLKAKGHPPGATGVAQCVELFEQLRGEAPTRSTARVSHWRTTSAARPRCRRSPSSGRTRTEGKQTGGVHQRRDRGAASRRSRSTGRR